MVSDNVNKTSFNFEKKINFAPSNRFTEQEIAILFNDISGFTSISEKISSFDLAKLIAHFYEKMAGICEKYNGKIIEFLGDGLFIVFGLNKDDSFSSLNREENFSDKAVAAAIEMQKIAPEINEYNFKNNLPVYSYGVGIHAGKCVVGNIGTEKYRKFEIIGKNVNLASRIKRFSAGGQIYISEDTKKRLISKVIYNEENFIAPKGSSKQIKIYSINEIQGLYNLKYEASIDELKKLDKKIEIEFYRVINKITQEKPLKGSIVEMSSSYLVIETNENVELFDTLEIFYKEKIWGKVVYKDRNVIKVRFDNHQIKAK